MGLLSLLRAVGWVLAVLVVSQSAAAQPTPSWPRVVLTAPASPIKSVDLTALPAAWRVRVNGSPGSGNLVEQFDRQAPPGTAWLTVDLEGIAPADIPALVDSLRTLVHTRPAIRIVEPNVAAVDARLAVFVLRQLAVELKAVRDDLSVAVAQGAPTLNAPDPSLVDPSDPLGLPTLSDLVDAGLAPLVDVVVLGRGEDVAQARRLLDEQGTTARIAVLEQHLPAGDEAAALTARQIAALAGPIDINGYSLPEAGIQGALGALTVLRHVLAQDLSEVEADLSLIGDPEGEALPWRRRVLFGAESLGTYVVLDVPDSTGPLTAHIHLVLPVAGAVVLLDPVRGREQPLAARRSDATQTTSVTVTFPSPGRWVVDFNRDADASFVQRQEVTAARPLTVEEIIARHQTRQAADRLAAPRYIVEGTMQQYFRPTVTDPGFDVLTENRFYMDGEGIEWEELSFAVNGARWDENRPPFPLLQPEKVLAAPLVIDLDQRYRYRLSGRERVGGIECYVVRFEPVDASQSFYRGTVWIAADTFARIRQQAVQTNLTAPVVSNDETQAFAPVRLRSGQEVYLPSETYNQQLVLIAGRNLMVERRITFSNYQVAPDDFDERRSAARRSDRIMYRDTERGARYFVKEGDTRVVSDMATTRAKAQAIGVTIDPSYAYPLPIFGINYLNFEFLGRSDTQLAVLFGGVLAAGNVQRPHIVGRRVDLNVDFFAIAVPGSDRFYVPDGEIETARVLTWPLSTGVNLGFQATSYQKVSLQQQFRFDGYVRDRTTAEDYTTPSSTVTAGTGVLYEYRRAGYALTANGVWSRRASWRPWGEAGALQASAATFERYAVNGTKTFYFGPFNKVVVNGAWFTGRRLDRFSQYQFGLFDDTRVRGVPSVGVRYGELAMARAQYSFNVFEQYRLDLFFDRAWGRTREVEVPWEGITGIGAAVNMRIPRRNLILRADVGKSFLPDRYGRLGSTVVQILFLRPL